MSTSPVLYSVTATLPDEDTALEYVDWLRNGHLAEVVSLGRARWGHVFRVTDASPPIRVESQYLFESASDYHQYVAVHSNRLRNEGLQRFPPARGISYERRVCEMLLQTDGRTFV